MDDNVTQILKRAKELSKLIHQDNIYAEYKKNIEKMSKDKKSQDLLSRLILLGKKLNEKSQQGEFIHADMINNNNILKEQLDKNEFVKEFIRSQKKYLNLIQVVMQKIQNPEDE